MRRFALGLVLGLALLAGVAFASSDGVSGGIVEGPWPEGVDVWTVDGRVFVRDAVTSELVWFCEGGCDELTCPIVVTSAPDNGNGNPPPPDPTDVPPEPTDEPPGDDDDDGDDDDGDDGDDDGDDDDD